MLPIPHKKDGCQAGQGTPVLALRLTTGSSAPSSPARTSPRSGALSPWRTVEGDQRTPHVPSGRSQRSARRRWPGDCARLGVRRGCALERPGRISRALEHIARGPIGCQGVDDPSEHEDGLADVRSVHAATGEEVVDHGCRIRCRSSVNPDFMSSYLGNILSSPLSGP